MIKKSETKESDSCASRHVVRRLSQPPPASLFLIRAVLLPFPFCYSILRELWAKSDYFLSVINFSFWISRVFFFFSFIFLFSFFFPSQLSFSSGNFRLIATVEARFFSLRLYDGVYLWLSWKSSPCPKSVLGIRMCFKTCATGTVKLNSLAC